MKPEETNPAAIAAGAPDPSLGEEALELTDDELEDVTGGLGAWQAEIPAGREEVTMWRGW